MTEMTTMTTKESEDDNMMIIIDDDDYVYETHVVGRLPFVEPMEPEIIFSTDQLWQDEASSQSDADTESILGTDSEGDVIFSDVELEETSPPANDGVCCECKLPRSNEKPLKSSNNTNSQQQPTSEASTASSEGQAGDGDLFQFRQVSCNGMCGRIGCCISCAKILSTDRRSTISQHTSSILHFSSSARLPSKLEENGRATATTNII
jgi:hypothetical protein